MQRQMKRLLNNKKTTIALLSFIIVTVVLCMATYQSTKKNVTLVANGKEKEVQTHADTVNDLLKSQGIDLTAHDKVTPAKDQELSDNMKVVYDQGKKIQLTLNDQKKTVWTTADTVQDFFNTHHIAIHAHDQMTPSPNAKITSGMAVVYDPGFQITVQDGAKSEKRWAHEMTVGDFLNENHISLNEYDQVSPAKNETITPQTNVTVVRVKKVNDVEKVPLKVETVTKKSDSLAKGEKKVLNEGKPGVAEKHFEVTYKNGKEVSRKYVGQKVLQKSENKIIALGTKEPDSSSISLGQSVASHIEPMSAPAPKPKKQEPANEFYVNSTAYTANCAGCSGLTTTGINLKTHPNAKVIAVDPSVIPLGSKVYVEGYGYAIAGDTGGAIGGHKIDIFFSSKSAASHWGSRRVKIKVLK